VLPALVGLGALVASSVQSTTGLGFALVLTPVLFGLLSPTTAVVLVTVLGLELNLLVLLAERRPLHVAWREVGPLLAAAVPGAVCGLLLLRDLSKPVLQIGVGVLVVTAAGVRLRSQRASVARTGGTRARIAVGFTTGAMTTSAGITGPPVALWFARRGMSPREVRDSLSALFLALGVVALIVLIPVLPRAHLDVPEVLVGLACVLGGHAIGSRAFARIEAHRFEPLLLAVILCAGLASVIAGAVGS
jgi:uncharacterized membrane protein YfcA